MGFASACACSFRVGISYNVLDANDFLLLLFQHFREHLTNFLARNWNAGYSSE